MYTYIKKILSCAVVFVVLICVLQVIPAYAASNIDEKISETKDTVQKLLEIKDDTTLSIEERDRLEFQLKKSIIASIIDISLTQLKDARAYTQNISFPQSKDWENVKSFIFDSLDTYDAYYKEAKNSLQSNELTIEGMRELAKKIEIKKTTDIDAFLRKATSIRTTFGVNEILKRADERLKKVESDVHKIYAQKLTQKDDLNVSFQKAASAVGDARTLNNKAKEIILNLYTTATSSASTTEDRAHAESFILSFENEVHLFIKEHSASSTQASTTSLDAPLSISITDEQKEEYLQDIIRQSAEKVRDAYNIFIQMSLDVKEYIKE